MSQKIYEPEKPMFRSSMLGGDFRNRNDLRVFEDYSWIDDYLRKIAIMAELDDLKKSARLTSELPATKKDMLRFAKIFYDKYKAERAEVIRRAFLYARGNHDPFSGLLKSSYINVPGVGSTSFFGFLAWDEIEAAIKAGPEDPASLSEKDRIKAIEHITKRTAELQMELEVIFPKESRFRGSGIIGGDFRQVFVQHWIAIQKKNNAGCGPLGSDLKYSKPAEQEAHRRLGIHSFVNKDAQFRPNDPKY